MIDALDSNKVAQVDDGLWLVMSNSEQIANSLITSVLDTTLISEHPGWKLVYTVNNALSAKSSKSQYSSDLLVRLAKSLCAPVPSIHQIRILRVLAEGRPAKDSPGGDVFRKFLKCFAQSDKFFEDVLPKLKLPTQDGQWRASQEIAISDSGVARRHILISELRPILFEQSGDKGQVHKPSPKEEQLDKSFYKDILEEYFDPWWDKFPRGVVGAFLSLFGRNLDGDIAEYAKKWLGEEINIEEMRKELLDPDEKNDLFANVCVWFQPNLVRGESVIAPNILGFGVKMATGSDGNTLFALAPRKICSRSESTPLVKLGSPWWEITLRHVTLQDYSSSELTDLLSGTVEKWTAELNLDQMRVKQWWSKWGKSSQIDLHPVFASIKAHLPLTLRQLNVIGNTQLHTTLRDAERAQRNREQAPSNETLKSENEALDKLANLIEADPEHQIFLWKRVNEKMRQYGYEPSSILLELAQNADDALAQRYELNGGWLPSEDRELKIQLNLSDCSATLNLVHWGRQINDSGGAAFPAGREERQWDQDLYFMMQMNLSGKPGETLGDSSLSSTTGSFGLGFKSIHLVSSSPSVVSGFIAFSIVGALLPKEIRDDSNLLTDENRRATRIRLPLRSDFNQPKLIDEIFSRFGYARALIPVFARQLRKVVVEGDHYPGIHVFDGKSINSAPGWSISSEIELFKHSGQWRILRFRAAEVNPQDMGTVALAVGLQNGCPMTFNSDMPFLWNVTPTSEEWGCGYVINGPFKLDPGRTHVSLDNHSTTESIRYLGDALGKGLIQLHDAVVNATDVDLNAIIAGDTQKFLSSLWKVLSTGLDRSRDDGLRRELLRNLHSNGRGIVAWMSARSVVPTELPAPFSPQLPQLILNSGVSWEVVDDDLDNRTLWSALARIEDEDFRELISSRRFVSKQINKCLLTLGDLPELEEGNNRSNIIQPRDLLTDLFRRWSFRLTPSKLHVLRPLAENKTYDLIFRDHRNASWQGKFQAKSATGKYKSLQKLLLQRELEFQHGEDESYAEEILRSAFAPQKRILESAYIVCIEDQNLFRWLRVKHQVNAAEIAQWYKSLETSLHSAAIRYLLDGKLNYEVLTHLVDPSNATPPWLMEYSTVNEMLTELCEESWRRNSILVALFPDQFHSPSEPEVSANSKNCEIFFQKLTEWWSDSEKRIKVISDYEERTWPNWLRQNSISERLKDGSDDHWLALFILGACQSLGRTVDEQHRGFLELAHDTEWWDVFKTPEHSGKWMEVLRDWQDAATTELNKYHKWMSLFPTIYQLSRYREQYTRLLKTVEKRPENIYQIRLLLAPRQDPALNFAGINYDAPPAPLNIGLHWVLRELVRLEVIKGRHLNQDCWVPSERVLDLLESLGFYRQSDDWTNVEKARAISKFVESNVETEFLTLHHAFDIPLRHVARSSELRRQFGLEH